MRKKHHISSRPRRGQSMVEFAISLPFLSMLTIGTFALGVVVDRHLTVTQLVRNAGNMYGRGIDFSQISNQTVLLQSATGMGMTRTGGNGALYLSTVVQATPGTTKRNTGMAVVSHRIKMGNTGMAVSSVGMPYSIKTNGTVNNYEDDPTARATLPSGVTVGPNEKLFMAEVFHDPKELKFGGFFAPSRLYSRAIF